MTHRPDFRPFQPPHNIAKALPGIRQRTAVSWERAGKKMALDLFHWVAHTTPAYQKYLKGHGINSRRIKRWNDFITLPLMSKDSYLRPAVYRDLFPRRHIIGATTIAATSGSTGQPFYFPRSAVHDDLYQYQAEIVMREQFAIHKKSTLVVLGFGLGIWIGGIFTYRILEHLSHKGYNLTIVPAGTHKEQFLRAIKKFGGYYDQIILMGYPPFIKDILDEGSAYGIRWHQFEIKICTAAEGYSELFRTYLAKKAGIKNMLQDVVNIYGTVELGTMAHETSLSNLIRHLAIKNKELFAALFPEASTEPTLCQFYPPSTFFEEVSIDGHQEVVGTGYGTQIPLIRYRFRDMGGVIPFETMRKKLTACGIDIKKEMRRYGIPQAQLRALPFVYVHGRSDFAVSLYGIVLYPEYLRNLLYHQGLHRFITGNFTMCVRYDAAQNQYLELNVEMKRGERKDRAVLKRTIKEGAVSLLLQHSTEYVHLYHSSPTYRKRLVPRVVCWPYLHSRHFARAGKQPWVKFNDDRNNS